MSGIIDGHACMSGINGGHAFILWISGWQGIDVRYQQYLHMYLGDQRWPCIYTVDQWLTGHRCQVSTISAHVSWGSTVAANGCPGSTATANYYI